MDATLKTIFDLLNGFTIQLTQQKLSDKYQLKYIKLYYHLSGTKQRVKYQTLADLWDVHIDTARYIINIFIRHNILAKSQQTDKEENNNRGYLFVSPLIHPKINN